MNYVKSISMIGKQYVNDDAFHIALTGTQNYIPWIGVTMASIMEHNHCAFTFHILLDKTDSFDIEALTDFSEQWKVAIVIYYMDDDKLAEYSKFDRYYIDGRYIPTLVYRFVIPSIIDRSINRVLYLDGDIVCNGDITQFMNMDMHGKIAVVSEDRRGPEFAKRIHVSKYFNAGILLIDTKRWNADELTGVFLRKMKKESGLHPELPCADQDILNEYLDGKAHFISHKFNMPYRLVQPSIFKPKINNEDARDASLVHFIGAIKPWTSYNQSVPIVKVWAHAKANSPWRNVPLHEPNSQKAIHQAARDARRRHSYAEMIQWYLKFIKSKIDGTRKVGY